MSLVPDAAGRPARILIVDDERPNRQLLEVMLAPEGFVLHTAASGEEALAIVEQERPELILLDVRMPGMDGYEVTRRIKGNPDTKVWVDVHTALYYCPGADLYGKTATGKYTTQREAQLDQFQPAYRRTCN